MDEFRLIERFFRRDSKSSEVVVGIGDDGAVVKAGINEQTVLVTDTLVAGVHFPERTAPQDLGYKLLAVNLSDLAAMGATPNWFLLNLVLPDADESWLQGFSTGLFSLAEEYSVALIGGDTARGPLCVSATVGGHVRSGTALRRNGAQAGDQLWVSGTLGDAAIGLDLLGGVLGATGEDMDYLVGRLNRPKPRIELGLSLGAVATAGIDVSDGLLADLGHILKESGALGAIVDVSCLPVSPQAIGACGESLAREKALTGGDDYEICFTANPAQRSQIEQLRQNCNVKLTCIGSIRTLAGIVLTGTDNQDLTGIKPGYRHDWL
ncbi:MAG: thiamine-phosphate kinase [Arenicellales bacterium]|nr:thiamine-phosphate kinase [Arenicellales bacterium]